MTVEALVFDLDGTLVDTRRDLAEGVNRMRADFGLPPLALDRVVALVGEGARNLVARAVASEIPGAALEEAFARFLGHYRAVCLATTQAYPGIPALLAALAPRYPMAVLTNKPEATSRLILDHLDLARFFRALVAGDTLPTRKPDPEGLRHLAGVLGVGLGATLLVGDSVVDAATARAAGSAFALAEWGFPSPEERAGIAADLRLGEAQDLARRLLGAALPKLPV